MQCSSLATRFIFCLLASLGFTFPTFADLLVFSTDFDSGVPGAFGGVTTTESVQGCADLGPSGNQFGGTFLRNATGGSPVGTPSSPTTLTLTGLQSHTSVTISFLLAVLESWDGSGASPSGDFFGVAIGDGVTTTIIFSETFSRPGAPPQSYAPPPEVLLSSGSDLGSFGITAADSAYNMGLDPTFLNIPHSSTQLIVTWFSSGPGYQGGTDESWAIDNVRVSMNAPEWGDYNDDGNVDAADYVVWRKYEGTMTTLPNDPHGDTIGALQFNTWRANFGAMSGGRASFRESTVPEPGSSVLAAIGVVLLSELRGRVKHRGNRLPL